MGPLIELLPLSYTESVVVLGARSNAGRFQETRRLADWLARRGRMLLMPAD